jgi:starch synthase
MTQDTADTLPQHRMASPDNVRDVALATERLSSSSSTIGILLDDNFDDWLKALGVSLENFSKHMMGSWVFNYVDALQRAGIKPVVFCISSQVKNVTRFTHAPTGVEIRVLPPTKLFQLVSRWLPSMQSGHGWHGAGKNCVNRMRGGIRWVVRSYLSTPLIVLLKEIRQAGCRSLLIQEYESARFDICVLSCKFLGIGVMGTFTGGFPQAVAFRPFRSLALRLCDRLIICARSESNRVLHQYNVPGRKLVQLQYPLDFSVWYPGNKERAREELTIPEHAQVVIYHGEILLWTKGLDALLSAWEQITNDRPNSDLRLILLGTGADAAHLAHLLKTRHFRGLHWVNQWIQERALIQRYLSAADIYVFPSRSDAFGISIIEAMACGLPVVASCVRGIPDIFPLGEQSGGVLIPPGEVPALVHALCRLLDDPALARQVSRRARRQAATSYSMETIGRQLGEVLLSGHQ